MNNEHAPETTHVRPKNGIDLIATERRRQISVEGYTDEHDDKHEYGEIAFAGACYAELAGKQQRNLMRGEGTMQPVIVNDVRDRFPWLDWFKPSPDPVRNLAKAGALIAAEIDRRLRLNAREGHSVSDRDIASAMGASLENSSSLPPTGEQEEEKTDLGSPGAAHTKHLPETD